MGQSSWIQAIKSTNNVQYAFPPIFQNNKFPSIITFINKDSIHSGSDGSQLEVSPTSDNQHIAAYIRPVPVPYTVDPGMISIGTLKDHDPVSLLCRFTSYISDLIHFTAETSDDACDIIAAWVQNRNEHQEYKPGACVVLRRKISEHCKYDISRKLKKKLGIEISSIFCLFVIEYSTVGVSSRGLRAASRARRQRQHLGLQWNWCMLNVISKGLIQTFEMPFTKHSHIIALDSARLPRPLYDLQSWLAQHWGEWMQQALNVRELCHVCIPVLTSSLAVQCQSTMNTFRIEDVFCALFKGPFTKAIPSRYLESEYEIVNLALYHLKRVVSFRAKLSKMKRLNAHEDVLRRNFVFFRLAKSKAMCYCCFTSPCDVFLPCRCGLCNKCCYFFGQSLHHSSVKSIHSCILCGAENHCKIRLPPATAGYRILELDGGGVRGITQLVILRKIQEQIGLPIHLFFDLVVGTSVGGINALSVGLLEWPISLCEDNFVKIASKIFPKPSLLSTAFKKLYYAARLLFRDSIYPASGSTIQSIVGDSLLCGPRESLFEERPVEPKRVGVLTTCSDTGEWSYLASYDKSTHKKEACYSWAQEDGALSDVKLWQSAEATSAAPLFFPARQIGSHKTFQDGLEMPLPLARAEGRKLWPHKEGPDFVLSLGCGIMKPTINIQRNFGSRYLHWSLTSLNGSQRYLKYQLAFGKMNRCYRIDPDLHMREVHLDETSAIPVMKQRLESDLSVDTDLLSDLSWKMVASLFFFQFVGIPDSIRDTNTQNSTEEYGFLCTGEISCRYGDDPSVRKILKEKYSQIRIFIGGKCFMMDNNYKTTVTFVHSSWCAPFDIVLEYNCKYAAITGFPNTIENILYQQHMGDLHETITSHALGYDSLQKKRKIREGDCTKPPMRKKRIYITKHSNS